MRGYTYKFLRRKNQNVEQSCTPCTKGECLDTRENVVERASLVDGVGRKVSRALIPRLSAHFNAACPRSSPALQNYSSHCSNFNGSAIRPDSSAAPLTAAAGYSANPQLAERVVAESEPTLMETPPAAVVATAAAATAAPVSQWCVQQRRDRDGRKVDSLDAAKPGRSSTKGEDEYSDKDVTLQRKLSGSVKKKADDREKALWAGHHYGRTTTNYWNRCAKNLRKTWWPRLNRSIRIGAITALSMHLSVSKSLPLIGGVMGQDWCINTYSLASTVLPEQSGAVISGLWVWVFTLACIAFLTFLLFPVLSFGATLGRIMCLLLFLLIVAWLSVMRLPLIYKVPPFDADVNVYSLTSFAYLYIPYTAASVILSQQHRAFETDLQTGLKYVIDMNIGVLLMSLLGWALFLLQVLLPPWSSQRHIVRVKLSKIMRDVAAAIGYIAVVFHELHLISSSQKASGVSERQRQKLRAAARALRQSCQPLYKAIGSQTVLRVSIVASSVEPYLMYPGPAAFMFPFFARCCEVLLHNCMNVITLSRHIDSLARELFLSENSSSRRVVEASDSLANIMLSTEPLLSTTVQAYELFATMLLVRPETLHKEQFKERLRFGLHQLDQIERQVSAAFALLRSPSMQVPRKHLTISDDITVCLQRLLSRTSVGSNYAGNSCVSDGSAVYPSVSGVSTYAVLRKDAVSACEGTPQAESGEELLPLRFSKAAATTPAATAAAGTPQSFLATGKGDDKAALAVSHSSEISGGMQPLSDVVFSRPTMAATAAGSKVSAVGGNGSTLLPVTAAAAIERPDIEFSGSEGLGAAAAPPATAATTAAEFFLLSNSLSWHDYRQSQLSGKPLHVVDEGLDGKNLSRRLVADPIRLQSKQQRKLANESSSAGRDSDALAASSLEGRHRTVTTGKGRRQRRRWLLKFLGKKIHKQKEAVDFSSSAVGQKNNNSFALVQVEDRSKEESENRETISWPFSNTAEIVSTAAVASHPQLSQPTLPRERLESLAEDNFPSKPNCTTALRGDVIHAWTRGESGRAVELPPIVEEQDMEENAAVEAPRGHIRGIPKAATTAIASHAVLQEDDDESLTGKDDGGVEKIFQEKQRLLATGIRDKHLLNVLDDYTAREALLQQNGERVVSCAASPAFSSDFVAITCSAFASPVSPGFIMKGSSTMLPSSPGMPQKKNSAMKLTADADSLRRLSNGSADSRVVLTPSDPASAIFSVEEAGSFSSRIGSTLEVFNQPQQWSSREETGSAISAYSHSPSTSSVPSVGTSASSIDEEAMLSELLQPEGDAADGERAHDAVKENIALASMAPEKLGAAAANGAVAHQSLWKSVLQRLCGLKEWSTITISQARAPVPATSCREANIQREGLPNVNIETKAAVRKLAEAPAASTISGPPSLPSKMDAMLKKSSCTVVKKKAQKARRYSASFLLLRRAKLQFKKKKISLFKWVAQHTPCSIRATQILQRRRDSDFQALKALRFGSCGVGEFPSEKLGLDLKTTAELRQELRIGNLIVCLYRICALDTQELCSTVRGLSLSVLNPSWIGLRQNLKMMMLSLAMIFIQLYFGLLALLKVDKWHWKNSNAFYKDIEVVHCIKLIGGLGVLFGFCLFYGPQIDRFLGGPQIPGAPQTAKQWMILGFLCAHSFTYEGNTHKGLKRAVGTVLGGAAVELALLTTSNYGLLLFFCFFSIAFAVFVFASPNEPGSEFDREFGYIGQVFIWTVTFILDTIWMYEDTASFTYLRDTMVRSRICGNLVGIGFSVVLIYVPPAFSAEKAARTYCATLLKTCRRCILLMNAAFLSLTKADSSVKPDTTLDDQVRGNFVAFSQKSTLASPSCLASASSPVTVVNRPFHWARLWKFKGSKENSAKSSWRWTHKHSNLPMQKPFLLYIRQAEELLHHHSTRLLVVARMLYEEGASSKHAPIWRVDKDVGEIMNRIEYLVMSVVDAVDNLCHLAMGTDPDLAALLHGSPVQTRDSISTLVQQDRRNWERVVRCRAGKALQTNLVRMVKAQSLCTQQLAREIKAAGLHTLDRIIGWDWFRFPAAMPPKYIRAVQRYVQCRARVERYNYRVYESLAICGKELREQDCVELDDWKSAIFSVLLIIEKCESRTYFMDEVHRFQAKSACRIVFGEEGPHVIRELLGSEPDMDDDESPNETNDAMQVTKRLSLLERQRAQTYPPLFRYGTYKDMTEELANNPAQNKKPILRRKSI